MTSATRAITNFWLIGEDTHLRVPWLLAFLAILLIAPPAFADGIDIVPALTWIGGEHSATVTAGLLVFLMLVNYILNFIVIGIPAIEAGPASMRSVSVDLMFLTLLGQVADRLGEVAALLVLLPLSFLLHFLPFRLFIDPEAWGWQLVVLYFLFSGCAVCVLALLFLRRRWHVPKQTARLIAAAAAILTNPLWLILIGWAAL